MIFDSHLHMLPSVKIKIAIVYFSWCVGDIELLYMFNEDFGRLWMMQFYFLFEENILKIYLNICIDVH